MVVSVSSTTLQLLDDSNLQAVAPIGHEASQTKGRTRETAARATSEGLGAMDGWAGGAWVSLPITHARVMFPHDKWSLNGLHAVGRNAVYAALDLRLRYATVFFFVAIYSFGRVVAQLQRFPLYSHGNCLEGVLRSAKGRSIVVTRSFFTQ